MITMEKSNLFFITFFIKMKQNKMQYSFSLTDLSTLVIWKENTPKT